MNITPLPVTVRALVEDYEDNGEGGVVGYGGKLDIRPAYQREFVYKDAQRADVIRSVRSSFPLNIMYWVDRGDNTYEVMDGQQRTISLGQYVNNEFSFDFGSGPQLFDNLTQDQKDQILDYELLVYLCEGTDSQKLDWFKVINIAGEELSDQERRNAIYHGPWLFDAKTWFSRVNGPADAISSDYVAAKTIRQGLLERALKWIILRDGLATVEDYMSQHEQNPNATDLWTYFQSVISWVSSTFPVKRKELKSVDWGKLYHEHGGSFPDGKKLEGRVATLMGDDDVGSKPGIYAYVLDGDERHLSIRAFSANQKREAYEHQNGLCANGAKCLSPGNQSGSMKFALDQMEADHIKPWSKGGRTVADNCQMLCLPCNRQKSGV